MDKEEERRQKHNESSKRSYHKHKNNKEWKERHLAATRAWRLKNIKSERERNKLAKRKRVKKAKDVLLPLFSKRDSNSDVPCCACNGCPEKNIEFLELDHISGVTKEWPRSSRGGNAYDKIHTWYKSKGKLPDSLRILCANCNHWLGQKDGGLKYGKGDNLQHCPHNQK